MTRHPSRDRSSTSWRLIRGTCGTDSPIRPPPEGRPLAAADGLRTRPTSLPSRQGGRGDDLRGDVDAAVFGEQLDPVAAAVDLPRGVEARLAVGFLAAHGEVEVGVDAVPLGIVGQDDGEANRIHSDFNL